MLLKFLGATALTSVEDGFGSSITVNPGDIIFVNPESRLDQKYPGSFERQTNGGQLIQRRVAISSASVLAMNTTPVALVPAPGAGKFVDVDSITATIDYGTAAYATNVTMEFRYTNASGDKVTADIAALLDATADKAVTVKGVTTALVNVANAAVVARVATGNPVTGDSPIYVTSQYRILTLP